MPDVTTPRLYSHSLIHLFKDGFYSTFHTQGPNIANFYHYHDYYEVTFYMGAEPTRYIYAGKEYLLTYGDIVFCNVFTPHINLCEENEKHHRFDFGISPQLLSQLSLPGCDYQLLFRGMPDNEPVFHCDFLQLRKYTDLIAQCHGESGDEGNAGVQEALLHLILANLYKDFGRNRVPESPQHEKHSAVVRQLIGYIGDHLDSRLTLEELAETTHYSVSYISQIFKKATGETLTAYILEKRLMEAKILIRQGVSPGEASRQVGFPNYSYFYRCFTKSEGVSPKEYRKK